MAPIGVARDQEIGVRSWMTGASPRWVGPITQLEQRSIGVKTWKVSPSVGAEMVPTYDVCCWFSKPVSPGPTSESAELESLDRSVWCVVIFAQAFRELK
jgi:hypothetical protein